MTRLQYLDAISAALDEEFFHFAAALFKLYRRDYPEKSK